MIWKCFLGFVLCLAMLISSGSADTYDDLIALAGRAQIEAREAAAAKAELQKATAARVTASQARVDAFNALDTPGRITKMEELNRKIQDAIRVADWKLLGELSVELSRQIQEAETAKAKFDATNADVGLAEANEKNADGFAKRQDAERIAVLESIVALVKSELTD